MCVRQELPCRCDPRGSNLLPLPLGGTFEGMNWFLEVCFLVASTVQLLSGFPEFNWAENRGWEWEDGSG